MKTDIPFIHSELGTLGVELEWLIVDHSGQQTALAPAILKHFPNHPQIKGELFTSIIELNSTIHHHTTHCLQELKTIHQHVNTFLATQQASLLASATHPFSHWQDQNISTDPRYQALVQRLQWALRRYNITGVHVHIGMPDAETCIRTSNHLLPILPIFLAISANSPFWHGHDTGLSSSRIKISEGLSQGGMPFYFNDWHDFSYCAQRLLACGSIQSIRDIWWEMRPHADYGTLEIRIGDMPISFDDTLAYVAYVRAETMYAAQSACLPRVHASLIRENRWRASRYGLQAEIIDPIQQQNIHILDWLEARLHTLSTYSSHEDMHILEQALQRWRNNKGGGDQQQRDLQKKYGDISMIHQMIEQNGW